jgi:hypothetical protein
MIKRGKHIMRIIEKREGVTSNNQPMHGSEYTLDNIQIWEVVVVVSIVWNEETISSIKDYSYLFNKQQINWETYHEKDGCRHKIKPNLS